MEKSLAALLILISSVVLNVVGFPDGAPVDACVKPRPNQPYHAQARPQSPQTNPYQILQSTDQYGPGSEITVTIQGTGYFKGFLIQARDVASNGWLGEWVETSNIKTHRECSAITHADPRPKKRAVFVWKVPPNVQPGRVYFTGTVLKEYTTFWSNVVSQVAPLGFVDHTKTTKDSAQKVLLRLIKKYTINVLNHGKNVIVKKLSHFAKQ